jgi:hypothetical protein
MGEGHYVSTVLRKEIPSAEDALNEVDPSQLGYEWVCFNDHAVTVMENAEITCAPTAYVLFYIRKDVKGKTIEDLYDITLTTATTTKDKSPESMNDRNIMGKLGILKGGRNTPQNGAIKVNGTPLASQSKEQLLSKPAMNTEISSKSIETVSSSLENSAEDHVQDTRSSISTANNRASASNGQTKSSAASTNSTSVRESPKNKTVNNSNSNSKPNTTFTPKNSKDSKRIEKKTLCNMS